MNKAGLGDVQTTAECWEGGIEGTAAAKHEATGLYAEKSTIRQFPVNGLFGLTRDQSVQFKPKHLIFAVRSSSGSRPD